ncbi:hypothetical protein GCM10017744_002010 [Streptomyces antimycoticus]|uniref:Uncharacterized protein n=1 Tax=Streptomyces antimycoticus TaxID=68175 RepID=A0A4D4KK41_9ACTN|nr:DUF6420 family protein [Streptomyces antimycoticus]GDY48882.1 hypothetical protein SANT12839_097640 [Streptomyces antimycoticus]
MLPSLSRSGLCRPGLCRVFAPGASVNALGGGGPRPLRHDREQAAHHREDHTAHIRIRLHHLGCPAQLTEEKDAAFKRLGLPPRPVPARQVPRTSSDSGQ